MDLVRKLILPNCRPLMLTAARLYSETAAAALYSFPLVQLQEGKSRYVLAQVYIHGIMGKARKVIRSSVRAKNHLLIYDKLQAEANSMGLCTQGLGGGFIEYDPSKKTLKVYGKSEILGGANHMDSKNLLERAYPGFTIDAEAGGMKP